MAGLVSGIYNTVPNATRKDRKEAAMDAQKLIESAKRHAEYMRAYNKRPEVKAKRRMYNKERWQMIKQVKAQLREEGLLK
jgi:hypothetical protein